jgi:DNA (cytosine-5)-methyltransferase 1
MAISSFNVLSLCAGIGGLDLGVHIAVPEARTVCYLEREAFAAEKLAEKIESGAFAEAPIYSDLETFDGGAWRGVVDCIVAGLPCQPYSVAGKRQGEADERYIWPEFFRILREVRPAVVFLENVSAFIQYFRPIGEKLSGMGYRLEAGLFSASEVGAPHRRERFFCLAVANADSRGLSGQGVCAKQPRRAETISAGQVWDSGPLAYRPEGGRRILRESSGGGGFADGGDEELGDADIEGPQGWREDREYADEFPAWPPGPADHAAWGRTLAERPELAPALADADGDHARGGKPECQRESPPRNQPSGPSYNGEQFIGTEGKQAKTQPAVRGVADGNADPLANRIDKLRAYGNAVVPLTAARAFEVLSGRIRI